MRSYTSLLLSVILAITLASCGKDEMAGPDVPPPDPVNPASKIEGTWTFVGSRLIATSIVSIDNTKTITYTDYTTFDNGGTVVIDKTKMVTTGYTYSFETVSKARYYEDGILTDEWEVPVKMTLPPMSLNSPYKLIGQDSIYYENGFIGSTDDSGIPQEPDASGSRISWLGDTLVITGYPNKVSQINQDGLIYNSVSSGMAVMKMVRKK